MKPCITCGELLPDNSRCTGCETEQKRLRPPTKPRVSPRKLGYDSTWDRLSKRARRIQPWCSDCGTPNDLTGDHSEEAWERYYAGKPIRLKDIDVVCRTCNIDRGPARPGGMGSRTSSRNPSGQEGSALLSGMVLNKGAG